MRLAHHGILVVSITLYSYPSTVEREGKRYYAYSDDLPGAYGLGKSIDEAKKSILQATRLHSELPQERQAHSADSHGVR